jgi:hypothetical protein
MVTPSILVFHAPLTANYSPRVKWHDRTAIPEALTELHPAGPHRFMAVLRAGASEVTTSPRIASGDKTGKTTIKTNLRLGRLQNAYFAAL